MDINYFVSVIFLIISFLLFEKKNEKLNIVYSIVYSICLLFCYNIVVVLLLGFVKNILWYSLINYVVGFFLDIVSYKRKRIQKYFFNKNELMLFILVIFSSFLVGFIHFNGFKSIIYFSDDSAVHYRTSLLFSKKLSILTNQKDFGYGMMPGNYINGGFFIKCFSNFVSYKVYMIYDSLCYVLYSLLFLTIILKFFGKKKYLFYYVVTMLYSLSFPLSNLTFGFGYLGIGIMIILLLYYTIYSIDFRNNILFNIIIIFMLSFSLFFSYYLFVPFAYLALFLYYIILYKSKNVSFKLLLCYMFITLFIPFIIGVSYFILPNIFTSDSVINAVSNWGAIYDNLTPTILFIIFGFYLIYDYVKRRPKLDYFLLNIYVLSIYVLIFLILYIFKVSELYYFYKLFYVYSFFEFIFILNNVKWRKIFYVIYVVIIFCMIYVYYGHNNNLVMLLSKISIYGYNSFVSKREFTLFNDSELEIVNKALEVRDVCEYNHVFYTVGRKEKNIWFYSIVGSNTTINREGEKKLYNKNDNRFMDWVYMDEYNCLIYFNENGDLLFYRDNYDILFENDSGLIIKRK